MNTYGIERAFNSWYGATIMVILMMMSIYLLALIIVRLNFFRKNKVDSRKLLQEVQQALIRNDSKLLSDLKAERANDAPVRIVVSLGLSNSDLSQPELSELFSVIRARQRPRLTNGLSVFGTFAAIAPFLGLLGTVLGIVNCFNSLATNGAAGPNMVAAGVAEALWATATGLFVAIPAVVAYNVFNNKAKTVLAEMEIIGRELLLLMKSDKKHAVKYSAPKEA